MFVFCDRYYFNNRFISIKNGVLSIIYISILYLRFFINNFYSEKFWICTSFKLSSKSKALCVCGFNANYIIKKCGRILILLQLLNFWLFFEIPKGIFVFFSFWVLLYNWVSRIDRINYCLSSI